MHSRLISLLALLLAICSFAYSQQEMPKGKQTVRTFNKKVSTRVKLDYLLFLPDGYKQNEKKRWPLIFFLHGIGERGNDSWKLKVHGPPKIAEKMSNFPFIVVSPQCPDGEWWSTDQLTALLNDVVDRYKVDQ